MDRVEGCPPCFSLLAPPPSRRPTSCVRGRSERVYADIKRHTAKIHYNLLPPPYTSWNRQPQQHRQQRQTPRRRIQSSGASTRDAHTTSGANIAGIAKVPATASMTSGANGAGYVAGTATASTERDAPDARSVTVPAYASTASSATTAPTVRTYLAPWMDAHNSATVSAQPSICCTTCARSTAAIPMRSPSPRS